MRRRRGFAWKALAAIMLTNGSLALLAPRWLAGQLGVRAGMAVGAISAVNTLLCLAGSRRRR